LGPAWTHEIALQDYDFLSKNGQGWFADIDRMAELIKPADRPKVAFTLHGWYGYVGPYNYNPRTRSLNKAWVAFPSAQDPQTQAMAKTPNPESPYVFRPASLKNTRPVEMSLPEVHRRLRYAKNKGFRVVLYYADGLNACDGIKDADPPERILRHGGYQGPDTLGQAYIRNPLVPEVRDFYRGYLEALIEEFGKEVDAYAWDQTGFVGARDEGPAAHPGHAGRAMMTLMQELTLIVQQHQPDAAFLAADFHPHPAYCLLAHGTYVDLAGRFTLFPSFFFTNHGNVLWACNWTPVTTFQFTKYTVEAFDVPVALANGPYGDDVGPAEMEPELMKRVLQLLDRRKSHPMDLGWIEEPAGPYTYNGHALAHTI
jgi:hypothetical protein